MGNVKDLDVLLVLGREDAPILEGLDGHVHSVQLVLLGAGKVEDHQGMVVVGVSDVGHLPVGEADAGMEGNKVVNHEGLANSSEEVVEPVDVARVRVGGDDVGDGILLPAVENNSCETILACRKANSCSVSVTNSAKVRHPIVIVKKMFFYLIAVKKNSLFNASEPNLPTPCAHASQT